MQKTICAVCHQDADAGCIGRLTGRYLTHWHGYPNEKPVITVEAVEAQALQEALAELHRKDRASEGKPRRHDGTLAGRG